MSLVLKSENELREFFSRALKTATSEVVLIYNDQRDTLKKVLREESEKAGRPLVESDLAAVKENELGGMKFESKAPHWMKKIFDTHQSKGVTLFMREYHQSPEKVKDDVLNIMITKEVEGQKFPDKVLIVLSVQGRDEIPKVVSHVHTLEFYRK